MFGSSMPPGLPLVSSAILPLPAGWQQKGGGGIAISEKWVPPVSTPVPEVDSVDSRAWAWTESSESELITVSTTPATEYARS